VGKSSRKSQRYNVRESVPGARDAGSGSRGRSLGVRIGAVLGVAGLLLAGLVVGAVVFAATAPATGPGPLPSGTEVFPETDHSHVSGPVTYDHVPPAGGPHNPVQLNCGVYTQPVPNENAVHSLEHGAVWITYEPQLPAADVSTLQRLVTSSYVGTQRYIILSPYVGLPTPIVASAWGAQLRPQSASDARLAEFIHHFAGGGQGGEPGGPCTGGVGIPVA
jgi:hypothetical protein